MEGRSHIVEHFVFRRGDAVLLHEVLGKHLAALDDGCIGPGAEAGNALFLQCIHSAQHQGIVRGHNGIVNFVFHRKIYNFGNIRCPDGHTHRILGNAAIAGEGVNGLHGFVLFQLLDDGVLTTAAADYKDFHITSTFPLL